jgi:hypothetical protein
MAHVSPIIFNPEMVVALLRGRNSDYPFEEMLKTLQANGLDETASRELIWHVLALGGIEFTDDRSSLRLSR